MVKIELSDLKKYKKVYYGFIEGKGYDPELCIEYLLLRSAKKIRKIAKEHKSTERLKHYKQLVDIIGDAPRPRHYPGRGTKVFQVIQSYVSCLIHSYEDGKIKKNVLQELTAN